MNKNLNLALTSRSSEEGFAIPIAVGIGLIMILISTTLLVRSQNDRVIAVAQKETARSLSLSEVGVTRTLSAFNQYNTLTGFSYDNSSIPPNATVTDNWSTSISDPIQSSNFVGTGTSGNRWIPISTSSGQTIGHFKIVKYTPDPITGIGTLEVLGTTDTDTATLRSNNTSQKAISSLSVEISQSSLEIKKWQREVL